MGVGILSPKNAVVVAPFESFIPLIKGSVNKKNWLPPPKLLVSI